MAAKPKVRYICQNCASASPRWQGRCPACGAWNSFIEEIVTSVSRTTKVTGKSESPALLLQDIDSDREPRLTMHSAEFNRVLGNGLVPGSVVLVGGDPGIGKSTLLLQEAAAYSANAAVLYIAGEESNRQIKLRADRLALHSNHLFILAETELESIIDGVERIHPHLLVVDSIQTIFSRNLESAPGSISQVRECALQLIRLAKNNNMPVFLVGHVTKEGYLAGPKVLEHMVDALLLFEGDRDHFYRILRAAKNRFGSTREIGVFEMNERGLQDVPNPSAVFLAERRAESSGSTVICCMEGTRPILLEIQALVTPTNYGLPQRTTTGFDNKRIAMLLAVLEKKLGYRVGTMDVFVNAVGGLHIDETAADLGILACMVSSIRNLAIDPEVILLGEVGLGGELRSVSHIDSRLSEAEKMGFKRAIVPQSNALRTVAAHRIDQTAVKSVGEALQMVMAL
ncbi:MAG TPA: DNA repair protein RadA [bacterium]|jgi:DNA repair protein RadA/Sms|nr:DNA repair protein RadA [bacterium]HOX87019.1 DNA repair protein RadA [bacterium]HPG46350.1 DNA repair protein RadA [bacterium]HPM98736.1 DNA repair protein RadA [bacterium]